MRQRFNRNAICSSDNYKASRNAHHQMLQERHEHFSFIGISSTDGEAEITLDVPKFTNGRMSQKEFKTIRIKGKFIRLEIEEYKILKGMGFIKD